MLHGLPTLRWARAISRLFAALVCLQLFFALPLPSQQRPFSVKDDIAMLRFNDPPEDVNALENDSQQYSPNGKLVAIVTTKGLLASDQVESSIAVFDVREIATFLAGQRGAPLPRVIASLRAIPQGNQTVSFAPIIQDLHWSANGTHIYFRGQNERGGFQLYEAGTDGRGSRSLTPASWDVDRYDVAGSTVAYTAAPLGSPPPLPGVPINRDALDATGFRSKDLLFPGEITSYQVKTFSMFTLRLGENAAIPRKVPTYAVRDTSIFQYLFPFRLSPDGRHVVAVEPFVGEVPASWEQFEPVPLFASHRIHAGERDLTRADYVMRARRYSVIDLRTGKVTALIDAPHAEILGYTSDANLIAWYPDGRRVLVTNTFLPVSPNSPGAEPDQIRPCAVSSVDLRSFRRRCLFYEGLDNTSQRVVNVAFGPTEDKALITLKARDGLQRIDAYRFDGETWTTDAQSSKNALETSQESAEHHGNLRVYVKQDLNERPALWVSSVQTQRSRELWDPNPQLKALAFAEASVGRWKDPSGRNWLGGVVKPLGYVAGRRYPLIVQMYVFREHQFLTDGTEPTAFAARALADAGFVVLQIQKQPNVLSDQDAETSLVGYESAVEMLAKQGLIDPAKVGVVGFSWTCWYAINALIKSPHLFAAATIADGLDNSYIQYMFGAPSQPDLEEQMNQIRGGSPFGPGLERWVREAPDFHTDQVQSPVRIEAMDPDSILQEWELYGSLYMQHKPVDLIYFPNGTHVHQTPMERFESQQGNVDWMRFWLQGYEDPALAKREQYERWRGLRDKLPDSQQASTTR